MPRLDTHSLRQTAVLWGTSTTNDYGERVRDVAPIEIAVRWIDKRGDTVDDNGTVIAFDAVVLTNVNVRPESLMWLGTLEEWYSTGSAGSAGYGNNLMIVKSIARTPSIKNRYTVYQLTLVRFQETVR